MTSAACGMSHSINGKDASKLAPMRASSPILRHLICAFTSCTALSASPLAWGSCARGLDTIVSCCLRTFTASCTCISAGSPSPFSSIFVNPVSPIVLATLPTMRSSPRPLHVTKWQKVHFVHLSRPHSNFLESLLSAFSPVSA